MISSIFHDVFSCFFSLQSDSFISAAQVGFFLLLFIFSLAAQQKMYGGLVRGVNAWAVKGFVSHPFSIVFYFIRVWCPSHVIFAKTFPIQYESAKRCQWTQLTSE